MPRPIEALIHADALAHNLRRARACAPGARVWAVVKANAYGHGIERAHSALKAADGYALLDIAEAERLRGLGWRGPILLLEGCFEPRDLEACSRLNLWHVVHREAQIDWLAAHKTDRPHHVYLKLNSGMNRLGYTPAAYRTAWARLHGLLQVDTVTLMTHFSNADRPGSGASAIEIDGSGIAAPLAAFDAATADLDGPRSLCNSVALLRYAPHHPAVRGDWVRPGIMLYGSAPDHPLHDSRHWELRPAMTLRAEVIATQQLQRGDSVGYGGTFTAETPMRIGVLACGYADGYPRVAPTGTPVLVDGQRTRLLGRVSMDMVTVDLTALPEAGLGSEATLWGCGPNGGVLPIDEVAQAAGTTGYELMCGLAARVPVRCVDEGVPPPPWPAFDAGRHYIRPLAPPPSPT